MAHLHEHVQFDTVNDSEFDYNSVGLTLAEFVVLRVAVHPWIDDEVRKLLFLALNEITASSVLNVNRCFHAGVWTIEDSAFFITEAARMGNVTVVIDLLHMGADAFSTTDQGFNTILLETDTAPNFLLGFDTLDEKQTCFETLFGKLVVFGVDINTHYPLAFPDFYQPAYEDEDEVYRVRAGYGPLHIAVVNGNMRIAQFLSKLGADWYMKEATGLTPLDLVPARHVPAQYGYIEIEVILGHRFDALTGCSSLSHGRTPS